MSTNFKLEPLWKLEIPAIVDLSNQAFEDYHVPVEFTEPSLLSFLVTMAVSWDLSRLLTVDEEPAGVILIARRGWTVRGVAMGILPNFRHRGFGSQAVELVIDEARQRGDRQFEMEVITANQPAIRLYKKFGFKILKDLYGYKKTATGGGADGEALQEVDILRVARLVAVAGAEDLPWQLSGETLATYGPPNKAFHRDGAYAVITKPQSPAPSIISLIVEPEKRGAGRALELLESLALYFNDRDLVVPALSPTAFDPLFIAAGFVRTELSQHHMRLEL